MKDAHLLLQQIEDCESLMEILEKRLKELKETSDKLSLENAALKEEMMEMKQKLELAKANEQVTNSARQKRVTKKAKDDPNQLLLPFDNM